MNLRAELNNEKLLASLATSSATYTHMAGTGIADFFVRSLDYPELNQNDDVFAEGSAEESKTKAILAVASAIYHHADHGNEDADKAMRWEPHDFDFLPSPVIGSEELTNYVLENHERGSDIAKIIKQRKVFTIDEIKIVLDHPETSLSDGAL
jgi:hypothetical protein